MVAPTRRRLARGRALLGRVGQRLHPPPPPHPPAIERLPALRAYRDGAFPTVKGWCHPETLAVVAELTETLDELGVTGGSCEIGVYRGKLLIALHAVRSPGTRSLGIDLFEQQELNVDASGRGYSEDVRHNLRAFAPDPDAIDLLARDSLDLTDADVLEILRVHGRFRWFSVDGGHTAIHAVNDVRLAQRLVAAGGIVAVDDYLNGEWPGVHEGIARLFLLDTPKVAPFCLAFGKLYLTTLGHHERHVRAAEERLSRLPRYRVRTVELYGHEVVAARIPG